MVVFSTAVTRPAMASPSSCCSSSSILAQMNLLVKPASTWDVVVACDVTSSSSSSSSSTPRFCFRKQSERAAVARPWSCASHAAAAVSMHIVKSTVRGGPCTSMNVRDRRHVRWSQQLRLRLKLYHQQEQQWPCQCQNGSSAVCSQLRFRPGGKSIRSAYREHSSRENSSSAAPAAEAGEEEGSLTSCSPSSSSSSLLTSSLSLWLSHCVSEKVEENDGFSPRVTWQRRRKRQGGTRSGAITPLLGLGAAMAGMNLEGPESVLEAIAVLAVIVAVHECGHFLAARWQNIHVTKFAVGFGPKLLSVTHDKVEYSLRAFPLGGFVGFPDDDPNSKYSSDDPDLLKNRPILDRALVISAGVIANAIFAFTLLFVQMSTIGLTEETFFPGVIVAGVLEESAAERGGLRKGDIIMYSDDMELPADASAVPQFVRTVKKDRGGRPVHMVVQRGGRQSVEVSGRSEADKPTLLSLDVYPDRNPDGSGKLGVQLAGNAIFAKRIGRNPVDSAILAAKECGRLTGLVLDGLGQIVFQFGKTVDKVSGPVAIVAVGAEVAREDAGGLLQFAALINLNLAVINTLPLPALDGGYMAFLILEKLRGGRKLPEVIEKGIMSSGILLIMAVGLALIVRDTLNLGFLPGS